MTPSAATPPASLAAPPTPAAADPLARIPVLPRGVRRRHDAVRGLEVLLGPERVLMLDPVGVAVLDEVDGRRDIRAIAALLAARFDAPAETIAADVTEYLDDLAARWMVTYREGGTDG